MSYQHIKIPAEGQAITANEDFSLNVPDNPVIPYIEGDGIGADILVESSGERSIYMEICAPDILH